MGRGGSSILNLKQINTAPGGPGPDKYTDSRTLCNLSALPIGTSATGEGDQGGGGGKGRFCGLLLVDDAVIDTVLVCHLGPISALIRSVSKVFRTVTPSPHVTGSAAGPRS